MVLAAIDSSAQVMMSKDEAERTHRRIMARDKAQARDLQSMYDLEGWKALGYASWDAYMNQALDYSVSYLSRLNSQVQINHQLEADLPERQTRELKKLKTSEARQEAHETAKALAKAENGDLSLRHIEMGVEQVQTKEKVRNSKHRVISVMMDSSRVSPVDALSYCAKLDTLNDRTYAKVITIIAEHGLNDGELISEFADMVNRESRTLDRILATGHINDKPIGKASLEDLRQEKRFSQSEWIGEQQEKARQEAIEQGKPIVIAHVITVYENAPERTLRALQQVLSEGDILKLMELMESKTAC